MPFSRQPSSEGWEEAILPGEHIQRQPVSLDLTHFRSMRVEFDLSVVLWAVIDFNSAGLVEIGHSLGRFEATVHGVPCVKIGAF